MPSAPAHSSPLINQGANQMTHAESDILVFKGSDVDFVKLQNVLVQVDTPTVMLST